MYFEINFLCESFKESKSGIIFHISVFREKHLNRLVLVCWYADLHIFLITMHEIDTAAEVYLEPFQTHMIDIFCESS